MNFQRMRAVNHTRYPLLLSASCAVSAAALMLGVTQAATIGIHFPVDWTDGGSPSYTGTQITASAFGIPVTGWQSLTPTPTGYNQQGRTPGPFTLSEFITTHSRTNGLHPLPSGSLAISWSASAANSSGFGDYSNGGPYAGNHPHIGEQQVYYGFLRDNVFLYTNPTNAIGYSVRISGLKSLFTNSPYVIQLVAATDTGTAFTNAFIKSASGTQSLSYSASRQTVGVLGGLSSVSSPITDDGVAIVGAPAFSDNSDSNNVVALASTLSAILITDKPIIQRSPAVPPANICTGAGTDLSVTAIGVPPLQYQWRKNGVPVPWATNAIYSLPYVNSTNAGYYDVVVSNSFGSATSEPAAVTSEILIGPADGLYLNSSPVRNRLDAAVHGGVVWSGDLGATFPPSGAAVFSADNPGYISIPGESLLDSPQGTITFWMKSSGTVTSPGNTGAILLDRDVGSFVIVQSDDGTLFVQPPGGVATLSQSTGLVSTGEWIHVAIIYDQTINGCVDIVFNGELDTYNVSASSWAWSTGAEIDIGQSQDSYWHPYDGALDDIRFYSRFLNLTEIASIANTGAIVDSNALRLWLKLDAPPANGIRLDWTCGTIQSATDARGPFADVPSITPTKAMLQTNTNLFFRIQK